MEFLVTKILPLCLFAMFTQASDSHFQKMLEGDQFFRSKESTVEIDGIRYRKVEYDNQSFYFSFKGRTQEFSELHCGRPVKGSSEKLLDGGVKLEKRKLFYFEALKESCKTHNGQVHSVVSLSPKIGIFLPESKDSVIKNKKVGINPLDPTGLDFSGDF